MMQRTLISIFHRQLLIIYMQFWAGTTHVGALLCPRSTAVRATMAANWNPRRFVISAQICLDLLFRTKSVIPCNSCQVVKHKGGWFVDQRQNHLQIFLKIENISGLWFTNPSLWISNSKQRDETPIPGGSFCRPRLVLVKLTDADGVVSIAAPVLWCWWWHQCFGVTLVSDKRGAVSPPDVGHQGHLGGIVLW